MLTELRIPRCEAAVHVAVALLLVVVGACGDPRAEDRRTPATSVVPTGSTRALAVSASANPIGSAAVAKPIKSVEARVDPRVADALALVNKAFADCEAELVARGQGESIGYPDHERFRFRLVAMGPRAQVPIEGVPRPDDLTVQPALSAGQLLFTDGMDAPFIVDLGTRLVTGVNGPNGQTIAAVCRPDVFPGTWH